MVDILEAYKSGKDSINIQNTLDINATKAKPKEDMLTFITNNEQLRNYTDEYLYQAEKAFRKWAKEKIKNDKWVHNPRLKKYKFGELIKEIFGRDYDPKIDCGKLSTSHMFRHYCSTVCKSSWDPVAQKKSTATSYHLSVKRIKTARPYSLRLLAEELMKEGIAPTRFNIKMANKPLAIGNSRNINTQMNLDAKRDRARKAYEQNKKKHSKD